MKYKCLKMIVKIEEHMAVYEKQHGAGGVDCHELKLWDFRNNLYKILIPFFSPSCAFYVRP
jgi:hypothetical protein